MNRRHFLRQTATTMAALPFLPSLLPNLHALEKSNCSLILIWLDGGMTHLDTFDCKPEAPPDIRGDLVAKESKLEGVFLNENLPKIGEILPESCLIRSITSPEGNHDRGSYYMLTGRRLSPVLLYPSFGSVFGQDKREGNPIPAYVAIPDAHPYAKQGFLPATRAPFEVGGSPGVKGFSVKNLNPSPQMQRAMDLLKKVDALDGAPRSEEETVRDQFLEQARHLSLEPEARALFDVGKENEATRNRYGRHQMGQSCLLARRLVEGGVRTVLVRDRGWDHHRNIARELTFGFPPKFDALDQSISALHEDLDRRGLLENTLVVLASEFGRTPRLNAAGGRDHWPRASSTLLFGAGLKRGVVVGKTDPHGEEPIDRPVTPESFFHTVLAAVGCDVTRQFHTSDGRPIRVVEEESEPVKEILA
ncbi:MAG: DUF1501 domain-containing protein [Verrucomicrobiales bacterium]|nr:DUF1501 domain-containing protein [Verrucomicrobiales bacterium]